MPPENTEFSMVVHVAANTSKELASYLQDVIAESKNGEIILSKAQAQAIASQLRITANLVSGFLDENTTMLTRIQELVDRTTKKD